MMVDTVVSAMAISGYENILVVMVETRWPSSSADVSEVESNPAYAICILRTLWSI